MDAISNTDTGVCVVRDHRPLREKDGCTFQKKHPHRTPHTRSGATHTHGGPQAGGGEGQGQEALLRKPSATPAAILPLSLEKEKVQEVRDPARREKPPAT